MGAGWASGQPGWCPTAASAWGWSRSRARGRCSGRWTGGSSWSRWCRGAVRRGFEQGASADRALHAEAAQVDPRERALAMQLAFGTVQRRATLDYALSRLVSRPLDGLEPAVLAILRLGLFQLLYL